MSLLMLVYSKRHSRLEESHVMTHIGRLRFSYFSDVTWPCELGNASFADYFLKLKVIKVKPCKNGDVDKRKRVLDTY